MYNVKKTVLVLWATACLSSIYAQNAAILRGRVVDAETGAALPFSSVLALPSGVGTTTDESGVFSLSVPPQAQATALVCSSVGYLADTVPLSKSPSETLFRLKPAVSTLNEVVVTGTMKEMSRAESPVPVEVFTPKFFLKNPTPSLFDALTGVNGVRPQLQCSVCNTGDIHINGMEGPYTMVMIDGMPIVSALSTVYGLQGIPNAVVERLEVVKGPASTLYGSEAVGGLINVITKNPLKAPRMSLDFNATTYSEWSADASVTAKLGKMTALFSGNAFWFDRRWDVNNDNFTDITLAKRLSLFSKWHLPLKNGRAANLALRYLNEDRFGGEMQWTKAFRGGDSIYGENIVTKRVEIIGDVQIWQNLKWQYSYNWHDQNSVYGNVEYLGKQHVAFSQLVYNQSVRKHDLLFGLATRFTHYDDNTLVTAGFDNPSVNKPSRVFLPGIFAQDEWQMTPRQKLLLGLRYDYNAVHGNIVSPRINYKWTSKNQNTALRVGLGNGFRVVNVFAEEHAALTGAREVVVKSELRPERSYNANVNVNTKFFPKFGFIGLDASLFYTYFDNKILANYDLDPNKIVFDNLKGYGVSQGLSLNTDFNFTNGLKIIAGGTLMDVFSVEEGARIWQIQSPRFTANYAITYEMPKIKVNIDLTGLTYSPMRLPIQPNDFRPELSPWFSIWNLQLSRKWANGLEIYGGVKNIFNFMPQNPIMRPFDPFDKRVGVDNPNGWTFDPSYNYAPLQRRRGFLGVRYIFK